MSDLMSVAEAGERLDVSPRRVRQLISAGDLEAIRVGRAWMVSSSSVDRRLRQPSASGRPLHPRRVWSIAWVVDELVDELAIEVGQGPDAIIRISEEELEQRLEWPLSQLKRLDAQEIARDRRDRRQAETALREALQALNEHGRHEEIASQHLARLFDVRRRGSPAEEDGGAAQLGLVEPDKDEQRAAIRVLRDRLDHDGIDPDDLAPFRNRAEGVRGYYAHSSVVSGLRGDGRVVVSGPHAGHAYGVDLVPGGRSDVYVAVELVDVVAESFALEPCPLDAANVWIRPVRGVRLSEEIAPRLLVAADLLEDPDPRSRDAALQLLEVIVVAVRWSER